MGPKHCIDVLGSIGSFMDGGSNNPLQKAAVPLLEPGFVEKDALALQAHFREKRDYMVRELEVRFRVTSRRQRVICSHIGDGHQGTRAEEHLLHLGGRLGSVLCLLDGVAWRPTRVSPHRRCRLP